MIAAATIIFIISQQTLFFVIILKCFLCVFEMALGLNQLIELLYLAGFSLLSCFITFVCC